MSSARFETILDFGKHHADCRIVCRSCGRSRTVTSVQLGNMIGLAERISRAQERLKCSKCGMRGARMVPVPQPR